MHVQRIADAPVVGVRRLASCDVRFKDNSIELVFKKEVLVLKYLSF